MYIYATALVLYCKYSSGLHQISVTFLNPKQPQRSKCCVFAYVCQLFFALIWFRYIYICCGFHLKLIHCLTSSGVNKMIALISRHTYISFLSFRACLPDIIFCLITKYIQVRDYAIISNFLFHGIKAESQRCICLILNN